jgi:hypothetical protein
VHPNRGSNREGAEERQLAAGSKREEQKHHGKEWRNRKPAWERSLSDWEVEIDNL